LRHNWPLECHGDDLAYFCDFLLLAAEDISQSTCFCAEFVIFVKYRFPASGASACSLWTGVAPSRMIFQSEMAGLNDALGIPIAAGALYPFFGWLLSPMIAGAAMSLSSVSVIGNALRLRRLSL